MRISIRFSSTTNCSYASILSSSGDIVKDRDCDEMIYGKFFLKILVLLLWSGYYLVVLPYRFRFGSISKASRFSITREF